MFVLFLITSFLKKLLTFALIHFIKILRRQKVCTYDLYLFTKNKTICYIFDGKLYKQVDRIQVRLFLYTYKLSFCFPVASQQRFLFISPEQLEAFQNFLNGGNANMSFAIENVKQNRMPFIIAQILCEVKKNHQFCVPKTNLQWSL